MLRFIGSSPESAEAQAVYAVSTWSSFRCDVDVCRTMGAAATVAGQNLGAGRPDRSAAASAWQESFLGVPRESSDSSFLPCRRLLAPFGMSEGQVACLASCP